MRTDKNSHLHQFWEVKVIAAPLFVLMTSYAVSVRIELYLAGRPVKNLLEARK